MLESPMRNVQRSPLGLFILTCALSSPLWLARAVLPVDLLPGLPISALMAFCPGVASLILVRREGAAAVRAHLRRSFDWARIPDKRWYLALLLPPLSMLLSYGVMCLGGLALPSPQFSIAIALGMLAAFFVAGLAEELGWSGYATEPLQQRLGPLLASVVLGAVWAVWHYVPLLQVQRTSSWIAYWTLGTVAQRVLMVWLFDNTRQSVFVCALYHAITNVAFYTFPNLGSHYDPRVTSPIVGAMALTVVLTFGPTLRR